MGTYGAGLALCEAPAGTGQWGLPSGAVFECRHETAKAELEQEGLSIG